LLSFAFRTRFSPPDGFTWAKAGQFMVLTKKILRYRVIVAVIWVTLVAILLPIGEIGKSEFEATGHLDGSEAERVTDSLRDRFGSPFAHSVILVVGGLPVVDSSEGSQAVSDLAEVVSRTPGVAGIMSYVSTRSELFRGRSGEGTFLIVGLKADDAREAESIVARLRHATEEIEIALRQSYPEGTLRWTGAAAINADIRRVGDAEVRRAELRALPLTGAILLLAFGALIAAAIPLICAIAIVGIATGLAALASIWTPMSVVLVSVVTMIGLGLSIDYVLLIVSRFREALESGLSTGEAVLEANRHAGRTVIVSGSAVAIGFASLLLVPISEVSSIGVGGILVVTVAMLMATTLLPVVLARLGPRVNWGRIQLGRRNGLGDLARRWGHWVTVHPWRILLLAGIPLVLLALQSIHLKVAVPRGIHGTQQCFADGTRPCRASAIRNGAQPRRLAGDPPPLSDPGGVAPGSRRAFHCHCPWQLRRCPTAVEPRTEANASQPCRSRWSQRVDRADPQ
jgi:RND superfamily putative drug exporter